ncbi:hypothetical protein AMAG_13303 [Allomyces macrogynus ATCC 38327]|uniref:Uncharacterized protein n=1 Tax=Allomyces macrogynus (strain ATCC 38327) TaxID=578462 RepID=A0A0L0T0M9_ALLM3|nr:hypothetical protein AMAG_13303 [Allomyces macrogynus ATCC 38327]|eukprot:KNE68134.1 hypothetical protein AMAG_13303 [Allomyces macrogynus ATCC 38327]
MAGLESTALALPGALLSLLIYECTAGIRDGLLFGYVDTTVHTTLRDDTTREERAQETRYVVLDVHTFHTRWYNALGVLDPALLDPVLADMRARHPGCQLIGYFRGRPGAATPSLREQQVWASLARHVGTMPVFLLLQHDNRDQAHTWMQACFWRHHEHDVLSRIPITLPNLVNSTGQARVPAMVHPHVGAGAIDMAGPVAAAQRMCTETLTEIARLVE